MKQFFAFVWELIKIAVIAALIVVPIRYYVFQPFFVKGQSMEPNFSSGDYLIVDEISYRFREPARGEVIVFVSPQNSSQRFIKRIIGLPGETVAIQEGAITITSSGQQFLLDESIYLSSGQLTRGTVQIVLEESEYFVLGDNRDFSFDSRRFGQLDKKSIIGRVFLRAWPIVAFAKIESPAY